MNEQECPHPQDARRTLHGFGQSQNRLKFFCTRCGEHVDLTRQQQEQQARNDEVPSTR